MKLYTTREYMNNEKKKKKDLTTKINLYTTGEF